MWKSATIALAGALLGGFVGYHAFLWALKYNFYAMILPGGCIGLGATFARCRLIAIPIICALAALGLSVFLEWKTRPFLTDPSWKFFINNLQLLTPVTMLMISVGTLLAFWLPFRNRRFP